MERFARAARRLRNALTNGAPDGSTTAGFDHGRAQLYEFESNRRDIAEHFPRLIAALDQEVAGGGVWYRPEHHWFGGDETFFANFIGHLRDRRSLDRIARGRPSIGIADRGRCRRPDFGRAAA